MLGYWNRPDETAEALRGGWMHTGDGGYMDDDGYVYIADRIKDMIITGGENVYSVEVENVLAQHPAVATCAVIGVPDEKWGERVHAVVVPAPARTVTLEELTAFCRERIAGYKTPRSMEIVDGAAASRPPARCSSASCASRTGRARTAPSTDGRARSRHARGILGRPDSPRRARPYVPHRAANDRTNGTPHARRAAPKGRPRCRWPRRSTSRPTEPVAHGGPGRSRGR